MHKLYEMLKKDGEAEERKVDTNLGNRTPVVNLRHVQEAFRSSNPSVSATERKRYEAMYATLTLLFASAIFAPTDDCFPSLPVTTTSCQPEETLA
jgi:hypothetical protein